MTDWTFHPELVAPFYRQLMGGNLAREAPAARSALLARFRERAADVSEDQLSEMLRSSWRPATVAAWFIAWRGLRQFAAEIERSLLERPDYAAPRCICLARLGEPTSPDALEAYVAACCRKVDASMANESLTPEWAVCALERLASGRRSTPALWARFVDAQRDALSGLPWYRERPDATARLIDGWDRRLAVAREDFATITALFDEGLR